MKVCSRCGEERSVEEFHWRNQAKGIRHGQCKDCAKVRWQEWRLRFPERAQATRQDIHRRATFGLSSEAYRALLEKQTGLCAICRQPETVVGRGGRPKALAIDHNHSCCAGKNSCGECIRGLLCDRCNRAVGLLDDSWARAYAVVQYLFETAGNPLVGVMSNV